MKATLLALATLLIGGVAQAHPVPPLPPLPVVAYEEMMVLVPGLEGHGYSRITTVEHCAALNGVQGDAWMELLTDSELEGMEACLVDLT